MGNHQGRHSNPGHRRSHRRPSHKYGENAENSGPSITTPIENFYTGLHLPYGHVDSSLRALAGQAEGFGRFAIGGQHGDVYRVTTLADDGPGSLRDGCRRKEPLWIIFEVSGTIELSSYLLVYFANHDKTMLIGADPSHTFDRCIRVTIHHCFFDGTTTASTCGYREVKPSEEDCRASFKRVMIPSQKKHYRIAADKDENCTGYIRSEGDVFLHGTQPGLTPLLSETCVFHPSEFYETWTVEAPSDDLKHFLQHRTGWQAIPRPPVQ
ncbi:hypothetical protein Sango_1998700 [Sesamum angolense]|uniref:Uncharacterized protein n=1 Tax=Sesamum angolense TaxID=2727404 RepID=A0AAE2BNU5_9LAMI|nr:hypothetical protein Sango_1998700 [Sesamum angolense]